MRNYQLRKINNELTMKKNFGENIFWRIISGGGWDSIYMYMRLCSLSFGVTLQIFQNSKKTLPK